MATAGPFATRPVLDGDVLYAGAWDGVLWAVGVRGEVRWTFATGARIDAPPILAAKRVIVASWDGSVYALDPDGALAWTHATGGAVDVAPASDGQTVWVAAEDRTLRALDAASGALEWSASLPGAPTTSPAVVGSGAAERVLVGTADGTVTAFALDGGLAGSADLGGEHAVGSFTLAAGRAYAGTSHGSLVALDADGALLWKTTLTYQEAVVFAPAIGSDGTLYASATSKALFAVDPSGTLAWTAPLDHAPTAPAALAADGAAWLPAGWLTRVGAADQVERWDVPDVAEAPVFAPDGWTFATTLAGALRGWAPGEVAPLLGSGDAGVGVAPGFSAERIVSGLTFPVSIAAAPDGTLIVTEKQGAVRVVRSGALEPAPVASFLPKTNNEAGLIGVTLAPDFASSGEFLVAYTPAADPDHLRVARLRLEASGASVLADPFLLLPSRAATDRHYGGNLRFGPDGKLYASLGELRQPSLAQDPAAPNGAIVRLEPDGSLPADNPWAGSLAFAKGLRNPFDFAFAADGTLYAGENGDDVADEVNRVTSGANHGWPETQGHCDHYPRHEPCETWLTFADPALELRQVIGATGVLVYDGGSLAALDGRVLVTGWHSGKLHVLRREGTRLVEEPSPFRFESGQPGYFAGGLVDVEQAPDGALLVLVSGTGIGEVWRLTAAR